MREVTVHHRRYHKIGLPMLLQGLDPITLWIAFKHLWLGKAEPALQVLQPIPIGELECRERLSKVIDWVLLMAALQRAIQERLYAQQERS